MGQDRKTAATDAADERSGSTQPGTSQTQAKSRPAQVQGKDRDMGSALRSVYQQTVDEAVPDDLLDLLGKLG